MKALILIIALSLSSCSLLHIDRAASAMPHMEVEEVYYGCDRTEARLRIPIYGTTKCYYAWFVVADTVVKGQLLRITGEPLDRPVPKDGF